LKVSVIYDHENGRILAVQYGQEMASKDVRNIIVEVEDGEQLTGLTIDEDTVAPIIEETQMSVLTKTLKMMNARIEYLSMMSGTGTEVDDE